MSLSIRAKLIGACGCLALITGLVGGAGLWAFSSASRAFQVAATQSLPAVDHLLQADRDMQRALVAERSLMFGKLGTPDADAQVKVYADSVTKVAERWKAYIAIPAGEAERKLWPGFEAAWKEWVKTSGEVFQTLREDTPDARRDAIDLSMGEGAAKFERARKSLAELSELRLGAAASHARSEETRAARVWSWVIASVVGAIVLAVAFGLVLSRAIAGPLQQTVHILKDIAEGEGDLTRRLQVGSRDEVGELARWFNRFVEKLQDIMEQIRQAADHVTTASRELSAATEQLAGGAQEQASSLEETAASLEEITGTVKQSADNARQANQLAMGSRDTAEKGGQVVTSAIGAMTEINQASKRIAAIITTIDEIAFQTNLLALNAAVEAARAGEQGRGFAVVASEVRNLAQRSAMAAKEIKELIQDSMQKVEAGSDLVSKSGETLTEIVGSVKRVTDMIAEIAAASQEQTTGIDQVNRAVTEMDQVTQSNAAQTEELSSTAQSLATQAVELQALVGRFKLDDGIRAAKAPAAKSAPVARPAGHGRRPSDGTSRGVRKTDGPVLAAAPGGNGRGQHRDDRYEEG